MHHMESQFKYNKIKRRQRKMESLKIKQQETEVLQFQNAKGIEIAPFVNERNILVRNRKAQEYSDRCAYRNKIKRNKKREMIGETISAILLCVGMPVLFCLALFV